jgi:hypothetical protein
MPVGEGVYLPPGLGLGVGWIVWGSGNTHGHTGREVNPLPYNGDIGALKTGEK